MNYSAPHQELTTPLIGTLPSEVDVENQSTVEEDAPTTEHEDISDDATCECLLSVSVPLVLLAQFGIAFLCLCVAGTFQLEWKEVLGSVVIFALTSALYRRTLRDEDISLAIFHMVPEITTLVVCCLVYFQFVDVGFVCMVVAMMMMSLFNVVASIHLIWIAHRDTKVKQEEQESSILVV